MYYIKDIKKYMKCPKLFWYSQFDEQEEYNSFFRMDEAITNLALEKLGIHEYFLGQKGDEREVALKALEDHSYQWFVKCRFECDDLRIKLPILKRVSGGFDVYFISVVNYPKENDLLFYRANIWVLKHNHINICNVYILHLNQEYIREDYLDVHQLFHITEYFYNDTNHQTRLIKEALEAENVDFKEYLAKMNEIKEKQYIEMKRHKGCTKRFICHKFHDCFQVEEEYDSTLYLSSCSNKYELYDQGIKSMKKVDFNQIESNRVQYAQVKACFNKDGIFIDKMAIKGWVETLEYPIGFVDFEWETFAIPPFKDTKPFQVVPFQYSLHILYEDGSLVHKEFLGFKDPREDFVRHFIRDVEGCKSIVAYNANGAEKIRIRELSQYLPQYQAQLEAINTNMVDLAVPFVSGSIYHINMRGSYTLKSILHAINPTMSYEHLAIHHGMDAVFQWRMLDRQLTKEEDQIIQNLKNYCALDTYAMIEVFKWMKSLYL